MAVEHIHSFLVHPGRGVQPLPQINGATVPLRDRVFELLSAIYNDAEADCELEIAFRASENGAQTNPCRDLLVSYLGNPTLATGRRVAARLCEYSDGRSGIGLLFLVAGHEGRYKRLVISRFPTDSAILAEENAAALSVSFLERVFMKSAFSYKAAQYQDTSLRGGFWAGKVMDRQINSQAAGVSNYWIYDFLASDFLITAAAGTRRLAIALREAAKKANLSVKSEIASAVTLAGNLRSPNVNAAEFCRRFNFSEDAVAAVQGELKTVNAFAERFVFDSTEFNSQIAYRSIELDNGGIMTAPSSDFDRVFQRETLDSVRGIIRVSTEGEVISERLKKSS